VARARRRLRWDSRVIITAADAVLVGAAGQGVLSLCPFAISWLLWDKPDTSFGLFSTVSLVALSLLV